MDTVSLAFSAEQSSKIDALLGQFSLDPGKQTGALARGCAKALNRAAVSARVVMVREIASELGTKQTVVKSYVKTVNATASQLEARVVPLGKQGIPLGKMNPTGPIPSRGKGPGVNVPGQGTFPRAFIATVKAGQKAHTGVFERKGKPRLPIKELRTVPIPDIFRRHRASGYARASESLAINLVSELKHALATGA